MLPVNQRAREERPSAGEREIQFGQEFLSFVRCKEAGKNACHFTNTGVLSALLIEDFIFAPYIS